jgi:ATP-dependent DNA helicase RecG
MPIPDASYSKPPIDDPFVDELLQIPESMHCEVKRVAGGKLTRILETIVAFANTEGGFLILGLEDPAKASGRNRVYGLQENPGALDEILRLVEARVTPVLKKPTVLEFGCTLRNGKVGSIGVLQISKSESVHSIVLDGTWQRLTKGNKALVAEEITRLSLERGTITAEGRLAEVDFHLLDSRFWKLYSSSRQLTRPIPEALEHLGLAKRDADGIRRPTWAAVLLFAEEPGGLLQTKAAIRIFHYKGSHIEHEANPNLLKPPKTVSGPLVIQITETHRVVLEELASGVQMGPMGFEIAQSYPARVIKEAITNAVIHRDYSIPADIQIRIFSDRIEVVSPGVLPGKVTVQNIRTIGSFCRNPLIVSNLRDFPEPPNLDAGEGVRMMFHTMNAAGLYPPTYLSRATTGRDEVMVILRNENRPSIWDQVANYLDQHSVIGNKEVRKIMDTKDTLAASKTLKKWVERGLLVVANPNAGKNIRKYKLPESDTTRQLFSDERGKEESGGM